jgi:signal transduction histidine kinase/putative methionine-R-sulfoxide reductase with GAF domain
MVLESDNPDLGEIVFLSDGAPGILSQREMAEVSQIALSDVIRTNNLVEYSSKNVAHAPENVQRIFADSYTSVIAAPMIKDDSIFGTIVFGTKNYDGFADQHRELVENFASYLSVAVLNQQLRGSLAKVAHVRASLASLGRELSSSSDISTAFDSARNSIKSLISYDRISVFVFNKDARTIKNIFVDGEPFPELDNQTHQLTPEYLERLENILDADSPVHFDRDGIASAQELIGTLKPYAKAGYGSALLVPLKTVQQSTGLMVVSLRDDHSYTAIELDSISHVARQIAGPVAASLFLGIAEERAEVEAKISEIGRALGSVVRLDESPERFAELVSALIPNESISVNSIVQSTSEGRPIYRVGSLTRIDKEWTIDSVHPLSGTMAERVVDTRQPLLIEFESYAELLSEFPGAAPAISNDKHATFINVPIEASDGIVGVLSIGSSIPNSFSGGHIEIAELICQQIAGHVVHTELRLTESTVRTEQSILGQIGQLMSSALDLGTVWSEFANLTSELVPYSVVSLAFVDTDAGNGVLAYDYRSSNVPDAGQKIGDTFPLEDSLTGQVVSERKGIVVFTENPAEFTKRFPTSKHSGSTNLERSLIAVPLIWGDEVVAVLYLRHLDSERFTPAHLRIVEQIATQISASVAGSMARQRDNEISAERESLASIGLAMTSGGSFSENFDQFVEMIRNLIDFDDIGVVNLDADRDLLYSNMFRHRGKSPYALEKVGSQSYIELPMRGTMAEQVFQTRAGILYSCDSNAQLKTDYPGTPFVGIEGEKRSIIYLPVIWDDRIESALWISKSDGTRFSTDEYNFMEKVVVQVAGFIAGNILRDREAYISQEQETLIEIGYLASSAIDISDIWEQLTSTLAKLLEFDRIHIVKVDEASAKATTLHDSWNMEPDPARWLGGDTFPLAGTAAEQVRDTGTGWIHSDGDMELLARQFPSSFAIDLSAPLKSFIGQPLSWGGKVYGILFLSHSEVGAYGDREFGMSARIAAHIGGSFAGNLLRQNESEIAAERGFLNEIGTVLNSAPDVASGFDEFARIVEKLIPFNSIALSRIYRERGCFIREYDSWRDMEPTGYRPGAIIPLDGSVAGVIEKTKQGFLTPFENAPNILDDFPNALPPDHAWKQVSSIAVPMLWSNEVIAILSLSTASHPGYGTSDLDLVNRIAAQIAGPLAGHLLREQDEERVTERRILNAIGSLMSLNPHSNEVADSFFDLVSSLISCDAVGLLEVDPENDEIRPAISKYADDLGISSVWDSTDSTRLSGTITEQVVKSREIVVNHPDSKEHLSTSYPNSPGVPAYLPNRVVLIAPLIWDDSVNYVLFLRNLDGTGFDQNDIRIAELIAAQIAGPVAAEQTRASQSALETERQRRTEAESEAKLFSEISETKSNFVSAMSHELKTPLTSIVAFSDILSRNRTGVLDTRILKQINIIQRNSRHLESMIDQLLDLSRMESGRFTIIKIPFDLVELATQAVENSAHLWEGKSQRVSVDLNPESLIINADRERILQVLNNLISNASKYSPEATDIEVSLRTIGKKAEITITDRGYGIPEDSIENLFEMFYRVENSSAGSVPGTGIGLNVSKRIIEEHDGEISVNNREGGGVIATFTIPFGI